MTSWCAHDTLKPPPITLGCGALCRADRQPRGQKGILGLKGRALYLLSPDSSGPMVRDGTRKKGGALGPTSVRICLGILFHGAYAGQS